MEKNKNQGVEGKVIVITGAGGVICSHFARVLAECGARVAMLDRQLSRAEGFCSKMRECGGEARAYFCDVLDKECCISAAEKIRDELGPCDILINGAGGNHPDATTDDEFFSPDTIADVKTFFGLDVEGVRRVIDLNFMGTLIPTQVFAEQMLGRDGCCVLNISSMNAYTPLTKIPAYSGAKSAVSNLTQWLAVYFSHVGIRVNAIAPGFFSTSQNATLLWNADGSPTERSEKILRATPMSRFGDVDELVGGMMFLIDNKSSGFVTGITLAIDGGFSAYSGV